MEKTMTKLWLTYAWKDNEDEQVDFVAQELRKAGLDVSVDCVALTAGRKTLPSLIAFRILVIRVARYAPRGWDGHLCAVEGVSNPSHSAAVLCGHLSC
jgi:hypothetical protein